MMRSYRTHAIVVRRINFSETDRILTLFSRDRGKLSAVAKGSRRINSSMSGATELAGYSVFQLAAGANMEVVTQAELKNAFLGLRTSLDRLSRALYLLEFCSNFLEEHQPQPDLFDLLLSGLYSLEKQAQLDWMITGFEVQAMAIIGYAPQLTLCVGCGKAPTRGPLRYSATLGGILCPECAGQRRDAIRISQEALTALQRLGASELPALGAQDPSPALQSETRRIIRAHIRHRAEKEMKSTRFIEQLRAESALPGSENEENEDET